MWSHSVVLLLGGRKISVQNPVRLRTTGDATARASLAFMLKTLGRDTSHNREAARKQCDE